MQVLHEAFLKVADLILDTEALAADKASKTIINMSRLSGVKKGLLQFSDQRINRAFNG